LAAAIIGLILLAGPGCKPSQPASDIKRYTLTGKIISVDKANLSMVVDAGEVKGFMGAMAMPYKVKKPADLDAVSVGDSISAELVVQATDYWLENVKVTQKSTTAPAGSELHVPSRGDKVPDFELVNQSDHHVSLDQYRGKALIVTFIYTQCPFPDYCPRVSAEFAKLEQELRQNPALYGKTHLLSISFDPEHDTPKALRDYGLGWSGGKKPSMFAHWEFAVPPKAELAEMAKFFGLSLTEEGGMITHSLSTAVIAPDGRIFKWYHGNEWHAADLAADAASAIAPPS
jgi:protein SCO1/2